MRKLVLAALCVAWLPLSRSYGQAVVKQQSGPLIFPDKNGNNYQMSADTHGRLVVTQTAQAATAAPLVVLDSDGAHAYTMQMTNGRLAVIVTPRPDTVTGPVSITHQGGRLVLVPKQ